MSIQKSPENHYDLILIGSGIGSLTVASLMAQMRGKKILVLERHFKAGGFTHSFKRQNFHWDVGIHYIGQMGEGSQMRQLFDLITGGNVHWTKMPDPFEKFVYPGFTFNVPTDKQRYITELIQQFPQEEKAIRQYFRDVQKAATAYGMQVMRKNGSFLLNLLGLIGGLLNPAQLDLTTKAYLDRHFKSDRLKALLASQWGDYGLPPSKSPFALHATIVSHYLEGGYYPVGGAGTIAASVKAIVEEKGGQFLLNREVTQVLIENGRAVGVQVRKVNAKDDHPLEEYYAPVVISNAGAATTYLKLIPQDYPIPFRESLRRFLEKNPPTTNVTLYLGLSQDPRKLGFQGENHWLYGSLDHDQTYTKRSEWIKDKDTQPIQAYLSFPSLKDPKAEAHTAEIIAFVDYNSFAQWREQPWLKRDENYQALKQHLSNTLITFVDRHYPGFADLIEYQELSTPITNEHFTGHPKGGIYGLPFVSERFQQENLAWTHPKTPLPGLYLTGADVCSLGIGGAMMGGVVTLGNLPDGILIPQVFATAARSKKNQDSHTINQSAPVATNN